MESQGYRMSNKPTRPRVEQKSTHSVHIERMYGSAIQQGTTGSEITVTFDVKNAGFSALVFVQDIRTKNPFAKARCGEYESTLLRRGDD
jgi:hypothetical protein